MRISSINNFYKVNIPNKLSNQNVLNRNINYENKDVVSFTSQGAEQIANIQRTYQPEISQLRAIKNDTWKKNATAYYTQAEKISGFPEIVQRFYKNRKEYIQGTLKASPDYEAEKILKYFSIAHDSMAEFPERKCVVPNAMAVVSKDKKTANDFIDAAFYRLKTKRVIFPPEEIPTAEYMKLNGKQMLVDFEFLPDNFSKVEDLQEAIYGALHSAKEKFEKSNIKTILHIENIEPAISKNNSIENIACMKDLLSSAWEDFHTMLVFGLTDESACAPGTTFSHRVANIFDLDQKGITSKEIKKINRGRSDLEPMVEKLTPIYRSSYELFLEEDAKIRELQQECIEEVARAKETLPKKPKIKPIKKQVTEAVETVVDDNATNIKNNLFQNKNFKMVFGAIAAVGAVAVGAGVLYNKYVKNKAEKIATQQNQQQTQQQTQIVKTSAQKYGTYPVSNVSSVFSEFQRIG